MGPLLTAVTPDTCVGVQVGRAVRVGGTEEASQWE